MSPTTYRALLIPADDQSPTMLVEQTTGASGLPTGCARTVDRVVLPGDASAGVPALVGYCDGEGALNNASRNYRATQLVASQVAGFAAASVIQGDVLLTGVTPSGQTRTPGHTSRLSSTITLPRAAPGASRSPPTAPGPLVSPHPARCPPPLRTRTQTRPTPPCTARPVSWSWPCTVIVRWTH